MHHAHFWSPESWSGIISSRDIIGEGPICPVSVAGDISGAGFLPATQRICSVHTHVLKREDLAMPPQSSLSDRVEELMALAQFKSLATETKYKSILEKNIFFSNHLDLDLSKGRNSLFSTSNMFTDVALKADVCTPSSLTPSSPPCYAHISNTKCILVFPFARLGKLISTYALKASSSFS